MSVLVRSPEQLDAVLAWTPPAPLARPELVYCDFEDLRRYREAVDRARAAGMPVGLATLRIQKPGEEGLDRIVPSYDLNWAQLSALVQASDPHWYEVVVHQHMPMFHMEHCVFAAFLSTGKDWRDCGRPCDHHKLELRDRVGAAFPVAPDAGCRNTVYNGHAQSAAEYVGRMRALGLRHFRVELLRETPEQVGPLLERYARVLVGLDDGRDTWRHLRALNQVGLTRGTLQLV